MPPLDSATINAVLQKQGMPNTTENLNRIAQFAAVHPDLLAKYLGQGTDAAALAGAGTDGAIDNSIAAVEGRGQLAGPNPYSSTVDPNTGMSNIGPGLVNTPEPTGNGPTGRVTVGQPQKAGMRGAAPPTEPPPGSMNVGGNGQPPVNPLTMDSGNVVNTPSMWEALALSLGPAGKFLVDRARANVLRGQPPNAPEAAPAPQQAPPQRQATGRGAGAGGVNQPATSRAPAPYSTDTRTPATNNPTRGSPAVPTADPDAVPRTGPPASGRTSTQTPADIERMRQETARANAAPAETVMPGPGQTPADIERLRAEIAAENAGAQALQSQIGAQTKAKAPKPRVPGRP